MANVTSQQGQRDYSEYPGAIRWIILVAVMMGTILEVLDISIVNVAIPKMMGNLGATVDQISWVSTGYIIANVIVLPLTGWLSSYFGRRKYLAGSIILFTIASIFCGTSNSLNELVFFRILQGIGGAALISTAQATLIEVFPPQQLGMVQGIYGIGVVVAPTIGPTVGGWITDTYSWPWIFFINIPIGIIAATLTLLFLKDSRYQKGPAGKIDLLGILFLAIGLGCMQTILEKGNREDWFESPLICWLTLFSVVGLIAFILWELHCDEPAVNLRVLKNRSLAAGTIFGVVLGFGLYGGIFVLPIFLQNFRQYTAEQTGLVFLPGGLATMFVTPFVGRLVSKVPPRNIAAVGAVTFAIAMFMMHSVTSDTGPEHLYLPLILRGAALGCIFIPLTLSSLTGLQGRDLAYGSGLFNLMRQLGGSAGIAFLSTFVDHRTSFHRVDLVEHISLYNQATILRINALTQSFQAKGFSAEVAHKQAIAVMDRIVQGQASIMAYDDALLIIGALFIAALPLLLLFKKGIPSHFRKGAGGGIRR